MKVEDVALKTPLPIVYIRYKGVWDMKDLYTAMADWFKERKYKFYEKFLESRKLTPFGAERIYLWHGERNWEDYVKFNIDVNIHTYDVHDIEVKSKRGPKKLTKGRLWMEFTGYVWYDWENKWNKKVFYARLRQFMNNYVYKKRMDAIYWDTLWYREVNKLHAMVKERLKMESEGFEHRYWTGVHR